VVVDFGGFGEFEAEVVVLGVGKAGVEAADGLVDATPFEAEMKGHEGGEELGGAVGYGAGFAVSDVGVVLVDNDVVGIDHADFGAAVEDVDGFGEGSGGEEVVAVYEAEVLALGGGGGGGDADASALVGGGGDADAGVLVGVVVGDGEGAVGGAVVPDQQLEVGIGLGEDAFDGLGEVVFAVVGGDDEGDRRRHG
jgi:hypothetical protein